MKRLMPVVCAALFILTGCASGGTGEAAPSAPTVSSEAPSVVADPSPGVASPGGPRRRLYSPVTLW